MEQIKDTIILQGLFRNDYVYYKGHKYIIDEFICGSYDIFPKCTEGINNVNYCDCSSTRNIYDAVINKQVIIDNLQNCKLDIIIDSDTIKFVIECFPEAPEKKYIKMKKPVTIILKQ